jgi:hypothetical protein
LGWGHSTFSLADDEARTDPAPGADVRRPEGPHDKIAHIVAETATHRMDKRRFNIVVLLRPLDA